MAEKIIGVYKITNTITNDFYIGSSNNVKRRWREHKWKSTWNKQPNSQLYKDMQKYGVDKFVFEILAEVEENFLKETEQQFIELLKPTYNNYRAKGMDFERYKEYEKSEKRKKAKKEYNKEHQKEYNNQLCCYNDQTLTLDALSMRFRRRGISNPTIEAKKYLLQ